MQIKSKLACETFNDGICSICGENEQRELVVKIGGIRFSNRIMGSKRYFAAAQADRSITDVIRVPMMKSIAAADYVMIGENRYKIEQLQHMDTTNPPVTDLTLRRIELYEGGA